MSAETFHHVMSGIQALVTSLGLLVGGGWAAWTFWGLGRIKHAQAEIRELELNNEKLKLEQQRAELELRQAEQEQGSVGFSWSP
jgi:hypothetical protein